MMKRGMAGDSVPGCDFSLPEPAHPQSTKLLKTGGDVIPGRLEPLGTGWNKAAVEHF